MSFEVEGKLYRVFDTENKTATFQAREFVIEVSSGNYPQFVKFQLTQDRCGIVDNYSVGDLIKVHFDLRGREWNEKFFTNLNAWRIENATQDAGVAAQSPQPAAADQSFPTLDDEPTSMPGAEDDLPF